MFFITDGYSNIATQLYRCCEFLVLLSLTGPSPPSGVSVSQNGLGSLLVSWTPGETSVTGYIIYYQQQDGGQRLSQTAGATDTSITITGLITGATYSISIAAISNALFSTEIAAPHVTIGILLIFAQTLLSSESTVYRASHHLSHLLSRFSYCGWRVCLFHLLCHSA